MGPIQYIIKNVQVLYFISWLCAIVAAVLLSSPGSCVLSTVSLGHFILIVYLLYLHTG